MFVFQSSATTFVPVYKASESIFQAPIVPCTAFIEPLVSMALPEGLRYKALIS